MTDRRRRGLGAAVVVAGLLVLAVLAERTGTSASLDERLELIRWLQDRLDWLTPVMRFATFFGDADFYLLVFPLLYWSVSRRLGLRLGVMLLLSAGLNGVLKLSTGSPRPLFLDPSVGLVHETTFGIPSGHAQNAVAVWGTLAAELHRRWGWVVAVMLMLLLGYSRVHLGAHFAVDVLMGWAVGAVLLFAYIRWREPVANWASRAPAWRVLVVTFVVSVGLMAAGALIRISLRGWSVPPAWVGARDVGLEGGAIALSTVVTPTAALFGMAVGALLLHGRGGFDTAGPMWQRVLRYPVGLVGVLLLWQGLGAVLPGGETPIALLARYVRYVLIGAWMTGGAPLVFRASGLAASGRVAARPS